MAEGRHEGFAKGAVLGRTRGGSSAKDPQARVTGGDHRIGGEPGLADAGLAGEEQHPAGSVRGLGNGSADGRPLPVPSDEDGPAESQTRCLQGVPTPPGTRASIADVADAVTRTLGPRPGAGNVHVGNLTGERAHNTLT
ncbi:hypothetical protein Ait01nite_011600 [Actinoplanes italicus]|nr:hypothetical protein Ait01nite_011600 [Actinoplanes italicus]